MVSVLLKIIIEKIKLKSAHQRIDKIDWLLFCFISIFLIFFTHTIIKAAMINIFTLTINSDFLCVKEVAGSAKPALSPDLAVPLSSTERFRFFQLIVLVSRPATSLFWFSLTALINLDLSCCRKLFSGNKPTVHYKHKIDRQTKLATSWWIDQNRAKRGVNTFYFIPITVSTNHYAIISLVCQYVISKGEL